MKKRLSLGAPAVLAGLCFTPASRAAVGLIDDFSTTTLSPNYTQTAVLDQGAARNVSFQSPSGTLQSLSSGTDGAEQVVLLRSDVSLGIGEILRADVAVQGTALSQDLGIAVSSVANPTITNLNGSQRQDYFFAGFRADATHFISSGFNGTTSLGTNQTFGLNITGLFIQRDSATQFEVGYNTNNGPDVSAFTYTVANTAIGNAVGFYTDMRASNTVGNLDNLRITAVPEPASLGGLAAGVFILVLRRRRTPTA